MPEKKKLLLTSAGGLTGTYLIKHLRNCAPDIELIGIDTNVNCPAASWLNAFCVVPKLNSPSFEDVFKEFIATQKPNFLIPVASHDVDYFSAMKDLYPMKMLIMDYAEHMKLHDKKNAYAFLRDNGIDTPQEVKKNEISFPCVLKKRKDSGSKNTHILQNMKEYEFWSERTPENFLVEFLEGDEFTVDCLFDKNGRCIGANPRKRIKTIGGGAVVSVNCPSEPVDEMIERLETLGTIRGPVNFQYKRLSSGRRVVFDFNTRFASGGLPLTVQSGFDIPMLLVNLLLDVPVKAWHRDDSISGLTMIRYFDEMFVRKTI